MEAFALWRRLDKAGHDAALLTETADGWLLRGATAGIHERGPASIRYSVTLDRSWETLSGRVEGFVEDRPFDHTITRGADGWRLDGSLFEDLEPLADIDFGFTPATNMQQLKRVAPKVGQSVDIPVVWFDVGETSLIELPQRYERRTELTYWYASPTAGYEGLLELAPNGFATSYPGLWAMEMD